MTNYKEILRLSALRISKQDIAASCQCSRNTVRNVLNAAQEQGVAWETARGQSNEYLRKKLFPGAASKPTYRMPDYEHVHKEMQKNGVTLSLLWVEYCEECRAAGEMPYQTTQFNKYYADYRAGPICLSNRTNPLILACRSTAKTVISARKFVLPRLSALTKRRWNTTVI